MATNGRRQCKVQTNISLRSIRHIGSSRDKNGLPTSSVSKVLKHRELVQQAASISEWRRIRLQGEARSPFKRKQKLTSSTAMSADER
jgi:hypothetical protein